MAPGSSIQFFDQQFQRQVATNDYALNPFETLALPHLRGHVLDYGCGLGNLAIAAAQRGCVVTALDASHTAIAHIQAVAEQRALSIYAAEADLRSHPLADDYDTVVCIGLLMFFSCPVAFRQLRELQDHVRPGGIAVVNVLTEGTTYMDMFSPEGHCLFKAGDLLERFASWSMVEHAIHEFPAPGNTRKIFATAIARKPYEHHAAA